jgi:predicted metal-dependent hydrolase
MSAFRNDNGNGVRPHFQLELLDDSDRGENGVRPLIRVSRRARRLSVRVYSDARVEVVVPPRARASEVEQFVAAHREWIEGRRAVALRNRPAPEAFPPETISFAATGETWRLHLAGGRGPMRIAGTASGGGGALRVTGAMKPERLRVLLRSWVMRAARARLEPRVARLAESMGIGFKRISVRRQRSRWGSCSVRGTISLNACLLFQRPEVVDYLIVHELTHVRHMNHSVRFWKAVEMSCPEWRPLDRELVQGWRRVPHWVFA